jgi:hypothetical protein
MGNYHLIQRKTTHNYKKTHDILDAPAKQKIRQNNLISLLKLAILIV